MNEGLTSAITTLIVVIMLGIPVLAFMSVTIINTGELGVLSSFGKVEGVLEPGLHFRIPLFQSVAYLKTTVQKYEANASSASSDLQVVSTAIAINYQVTDNEGTVLELYKQFRGDYQSVIIDPLVQEAVKSNTARYNANELITKRSEVKNAITNDLKSRLSQYHLNVIEVSITDFDFSPEFNKAIEAKVVAEQTKLQAQVELERKQIEVQLQIAEANASATSELLRAEADAKARLIRANSEAQAVKTISDAMTDPYIRYNFVEKWNGELPKVVPPSNTIVDVGGYVGN